MGNQKKCRAYISKDAQIKALKERIKQLEEELKWNPQRVDDKSGPLVDIGTDI